MISIQMHKLPHEICSHIYEYDTTYREIMNTIIKEIPTYKYFTFQNEMNEKFFYVYCPKSFSFHMTNSLESPSFISSCYNINYIKLRKLVEFHNIQEINNVSVNYDIENNCGQPYLLDSVV